MCLLNITLPLPHRDIPTNVAICVQLSWSIAMSSQRNIFEKIVPPVSLNPRHIYQSGSLTQLFLLTPCCFIFISEWSNNVPHVHVLIHLESMNVSWNVNAVLCVNANMMFGSVDYTWQVAHFGPLVNYPWNWRVISGLRWFRYHTLTLLKVYALT